MKNLWKQTLSKTEYYDLLKRSWQIILHNKLIYPVNAFALARAYNARVITYTEYCMRSGMTPGYLIDNISDHGFCFKSSINNQYYIVYNNQILLKGSQKWTITHELMHIISGDIHEPNIIMPRSHTKTKCEVVSDMLTRRILAPLCLLHLADAQSIDEVMAITGLSFDASKHALSECLRRRHKSKFGTIELELAVMDMIARQQDVKSDKIHIW